MKTKPIQSNFAIAACSFELDGNGRAQLMPAGQFASRDGRPTDAPYWFVDSAIAAVLIADMAAQADKVVIDYEHQTLLSVENGQPAPAAGWMLSADWVEGEGLFVTVDWTDRARAHIVAGEYKYISPVLLYDKKTGHIKKIINAALTNSPAIDGMAEVAARLSVDFKLTTTKKEDSMDLEELLEDLRWFLNLPKLATADDVANELQKAVALIKGSAGSDAIAANSLGVAGGYVAQGTELVALRQKLTTTSAELVALRAKQLDDEVAGVVQAAMGVKLSPGQRESMIELGKTNIALLKSVIESAPPVVPHGELAAADLTIGVAQSGFVVPRGCEVDVASAALCSKAEDYAAKHGVDFLVAVKKVQSI